MSSTREFTYERAFRPLLLVNGRNRRESLQAYEARGGYGALRRALERITPGEMIEELAGADLRGKGGAGFPTAKKWAMVAGAAASTRYVVCNGGEHEPGSRKDRTLLECHPHAVLEGALLAAYAVGAQAVYFYITKDQHEAIASVRDAMRECSEAGYPDLLSQTGRSVRPDLICFAGPSTYVSGEETAALNAIEGKDAKPRAKPPYPTVEGLFGEPTLINNVETLALVPVILNHGAESVARGGVLVTLTGVERPGVYEVPYGIPLRVLIERYGGGTGGKAVKAVLPGGPSLPFLGADQLDTPLSPDALQAAGSGLGCGAIRVWTEDACMVEAALDIAEFFAREQCGQCALCRMETSTLGLVLRKLSKGSAGANAPLQIEKAAAFARGKGLCSLPAMAAAPVLSAMRLFATDFQHHIEHHRCRLAAS